MRPEYLNILAILLSTASVITGYLAVGKLGLWEFPKGLKPYLEGNSRAWLYILVICTTIVSLLHMTLLTDWYIQDAVLKNPLGSVRLYSWMTWHCLIEVAFTGLHIWAKRYRMARQDTPVTYFRELDRDIP